MLARRPARRAHRRLPGRADHADPRPRPAAGPRARLRQDVPAPARGRRLGTALERGVKIVTNAGGLNPAGLAAAVRALAARCSGSTSRSPTSRATTCSPAPASSGSASRSPPTPTWARGASPSACAPAPTSSSPAGSPTRRWSSARPPRTSAGRRTDFDALAGAAVAGHVIECGAQATGGNYAFFTELADLRHPGFPIAEVAAGRLGVITKHAGHRRRGHRRHRHRAAALRDRRRRATPAPT